jgi:hypothetical protein
MLVARKAAIKTGAAAGRDRIGVFAGITALLLTQCSFEIRSRFPERK